MRRREFFSVLGGAAAAWPLAARAQQAEGVARVGILAPPRDGPVSRIAYPHFFDELSKLGFVEGRNLVVEFGRIDEGVPMAYAAANEMVASKTSVLVAFGPELALQAAIAARPAVPIVVVAQNYDPIARGYVKSLAQPGGNVTGIVSLQPELAGKQLDLLVEAFPDRKRIGALWDTFSADQFSASENAARSLGLSLLSFKLEGQPYDLDTAFRTLTQDGVQMLHVLGGPYFVRQSTQIAELAIKYRLPHIHTLRTYVDAGGLMSYGVDFSPMLRRAASYVAKILHGAKPADLPVEQVSTFEFVVNLKTAKAMGVTLPTSILLRANRVIE